MREDYNLIELSEICTYSKGKKPKILTSEFSEFTPYPYINIKAFEKEIFDQYTDGEKCNLCKEGDLLMVWDGARSGYTGKAKSGAVGSTLMKIEPKKNIKKEYLFYFLLSLYIKLNTNPRGVGIPHVEPRLLWNSKIPLISLPEQRTIVAKIEQLFSELANGIANLKTAQEQLKVYRLSVLSSVMNSKKTVLISEIIDDLTQGWSPKCINRKSENPEEWAVIKTSAVQGGRFLEVENKILPTNLSPREQHEILKDDILITRAGPRVRVGICCLVKKTRPRLINCDKVYRIRVNKKIVMPEFFEYSMNAPEHLKLIEKIKTGSSDSGLNLTQARFLNLQIPLPSLQEQQQIVQQIESRLSVCDKVEETITENLQKAEALRQSILKKAFAGELLTDTEITACKKEKDWEPAGELLKRIKK